MAETSTEQQMLDQEMIARIGRRDQSAFSAPACSAAVVLLGSFWLVQRIWMT